MSSTAVNSGRHAPLDGVRGLAILIVLVHNAAWITQPDGHRAMQLVMAATATGWIGVQLFFVLSGFLITGTLLDAVGSRTAFRSFYLRRTLRIFPLYFAFLALAVLAGPLVVQSPEWIASIHRYQWWYWTYLSNWGAPFGRSVEGLTHFWSLAVEEQFYLLWPMVILWLTRRRALVFTVLIIAGTPFVRLLLARSGLPPDVNYTFTIARWDALACGALLMMLWRDQSARRQIASAMPWLAMSGVLALLLLVLRQHGFHENELPIQLVGQSVVSMLCVLLLYGCIAESRRAQPLQRWLSVGWLRFLGKYSYAVYVFHVPIHRLLASPLAPWVNEGSAALRLARLAAYIAVVSLLSCTAALLSWRLLEKPCLDLRQRFAPRPQLTIDGSLAAP